MLVISVYGGNMYEHMNTAFEKSGENTIRNLQNLMIWLDSAVTRQNPPNGKSPAIKIPLAIRICIGNRAFTFSSLKSF